jgi:DHA1 family tetracycline resistance protein-like MFS transporter
VNRIRIAERLRRARDLPQLDAMSTRQPALRFIFITLMLDVLGFGLLIPVAPDLVRMLLHPGELATQAQAAPYVGWLQSTFYAMSFLFAPALGVLSDRVGRRPVILISLLGSGLDYFAMALAPNMTWLFITRVINGLSGASFTVASAYVADVTPPERRAAGFGLIGAAFGLGFVIGPVIGGFLGHVDIRLPFWVAGGLTMVNWAYGLFILPESLPRNLRRPFNFKRANPMGAFHGLGRYPLVLGLAISLFMVNMAQFGLHATWALAMEYRFDWNPVQIGTSLAVVGLCAAAVQGGLARRLIPLISERRALMLGLAMAVLAYIGYGAATQGWMIYAIIAVASLGAISQPAGQSLITREVLPNEQGTIQGALASLNSIAGIVGPMVGSQTFAHFARPEHPLAGSRWFNPAGANFYVSALLAGLGWIAAVWAVRHHHERRASQPPPPTPPLPS